MMSFLNGLKRVQRTLFDISFDFVQESMGFSWKKHNSFHFHCTQLFWLFLLEMTKASKLMHGKWYAEVYLVVMPFKCKQVSLTSQQEYIYFMILPPQCLVFYQSTSSYICYTKISPSIDVWKSNLFSEFLPNDFTASIFAPSRSFQ